MSGQVQESVAVTGGIVIGYNGSPSSERALSWAAEDCDRRGCELHVLRAWTVPTATRPDSWSPSYVPSLPEFEAAVREQTEGWVTELLRDYPGARWTVHPVYGQPARALIAASERAELLVVGHSGSGGLAGLLVGSVSEQVVKRAACPVVVVQPESEERSDSPTEPGEELAAQPVSATEE